MRYTRAYKHVLSGVPGVPASGFMGVTLLGAAKMLLAVAEDWNRARRWCLS